MNENQKLVEKFYAAFRKLDGKAMTECYHPEAHFSDAVFIDLNGAEIGRMWRMLCAKGAGLRIELSNVQATGSGVTAHWDVYYNFSATGRPVHNSIDARFEFRDRLIYRHHDEFSFYRWARQALGPVGMLLGWTPLIRNKVRRTAASNLAGFTG
ncbi:MAG: nuclear transport factor 2 family protein [Geobacteraceae bacterium]|nr:nuclear transport factor 2 family protein [Geobacteraceae bacterium]